VITATLDPTLAGEWLNLLLRWIHVTAGIMWIGDSFLFMWMDRSLRAPSRPREGEVAGELWMVHSGGFYEVVKRRRLAPGEVPEHLHWFKWEAYSTWISGFFLLGLVYFTGRGMYLLDAARPGLGFGPAVAIALGSLGVGWIVYHGLWTSPLAARPRLAGWFSFALIVGAAIGFTRLFSGRAAYLMMGATLGTIMVANVAMVIIPAQRRMIAATRAGEASDPALGARAKARSTHNHYLTLPVLFTMLSNHYPGMWGHPLAWLVLVLVMVFGAAAKYVMNERGRSNRWIVLAGVASLAAAVAITLRAPRPAAGTPDFRGAPPVSFASARAIIEQRCLSCHARHPAHPSFPVPPNGIVLEEPREIRALAPRIMARAVVTRTMPLGNLTGMTEEERATLGAWIAQGARIEGSAPPP
jgi:uncharacterized membrane protein